MKVDIKKLAIVLVEVFELEDLTMLHAVTPEGRWQLLQRWIKERPRWQRRIAHWRRMTPDAAYEELREWVSKESELPLAMLKAFISADIEARIKRAIVSIQNLYNERAKDAPRPMEIEA